MLTNDQIFHAEQLRTIGRYTDAYEIARDILNYLPSEIATMNSTDQTRVLMTLRIAWGSMFSIMKTRRNGNEFLRALKICRGFLYTYYKDRFIISLAYKTTVDVRGDAYAFYDEMRRDMWRYEVFLAQLTEDEQDFENATLRGILIAGEMKDEGTKWLVLFEHELFQVDVNKYLLEETVRAYTQCLDIAKKRNQWERVATVCARFIISCMKHGQKKMGLSELRLYVSAIYHDRHTWSILPREIVKSLLEKRFIKALQKETLGTDWDRYRL